MILGEPSHYRINNFKKGTQCSYCNSIVVGKVEGVPTGRLNCLVECWAISNTVRLFVLEIIIR